jgi:hypothetical protein
MIRKIHKEIDSVNILDVTVEHNGFQGGDSGHGGFVKITLKDLGSTDMRCKVNKKSFDDVEEIQLFFGGDSERSTLVEALKIIINELENNTDLRDHREDNSIISVDLTEKLEKRNDIPFGPSD